MSLINKLEPKYGRYAFPALIQTISVFWIVTFILLKINPALIEMLVFDTGKILKGQVWRIFTFVLIPPATDPLFLFIAVYFNFFIGQLLDNAWGPFRVNAFMFCGILLIFISSLIVYFAAPSWLIFPAVAGLALMGSIFLSVSCLFPDLEIRVMFIIPVKMKWLGLISGGGLVLLALRGFQTGAAIFVGLLPFIAVFVPQYFRYSKSRAFVADRKRKFVSQVRGADESLHHCAVCHVTEHDDPERAFRVSGGEEYCAPCLEEKKKAEA